MDNIGTTQIKKYMHNSINKIMHICVITPNGIGNHFYITSNNPVLEQIKMYNKNKYYFIYDDIIIDDLNTAFTLGLSNHAIIQAVIIRKIE